MIFLGSELIHNGTRVSRFAIEGSELTKQNLHRALAHVVVTVESLPAQCAHFLANVPAVVVEQLDEAFENVEVEGWRDQFPMGSPFVTCK